MSFRPKLKSKIIAFIFALLPAFFVGSLVFGASTYYDLDAVKIITNEVQRIVKSGQVALEVLGITRLGDGGATDYAEFSQTGDLTFAGSADTISKTNAALAIQTTAQNLTLQTVDSGALALTSAGALNFTGAAASTWSIGTGNALTLTSSAFRVADTGNITVAGGYGLDTIAAGILNIGNTTATTVNVGNTAATTLAIGAGGTLTRTINIGTGTGADSINIGTGGTGSDIIAIGGGVGTLAINTGDWDISTTGAMTGISGITSDSTYTQTAGNFAMSGAGTFGTGTGAISLNGATSVTGTNTFTVGTGLTTLGGNLTFSDAQKIIGGSSTTADLTFQTTSGVGADGADMHFLTGNNGATEAMTILNNGNVGIGITAPSSKFEINGGSDDVYSTLLSGASNKFAGLRIGRTASESYFATVAGNNQIITGAVAGDTVLRSGANMLFGISTIEAMRISSSGNVGIGTISPTAVLHLKAGTATENTAPLKFTSGTLNTTAEAGAMEFLTDAYYGTITTGAARKTFAFLESPTFTGTVTLPTPFTLGATSVTTTGTQLNYLNAATGTTGTTSTNLVFSTSPTLVTPVLGAATYTTLSGGNITDSALTAGRVTFAGTAGILSDDADLTFATDTLSATKLLSSTSVSTPSLISTGALTITPAAGSNLNVALSTTGDFAVNTSQLYVDTSAGNVGIGTTSSTDKLTVRSDSAGTSVSLVRLENLGAATIGSGGSINFYANRTTGGSTLFGSIESLVTSIDNTNYSSEMKFKIAADGTLTSIMELDNSNMVINRPLEVNVAGDTGMSYDLAFLSTGTSSITSEGPLQILAGDTNNSENLTLSTMSNNAVGDSGVATSANATTLTDSIKAFTVDEWIGGEISIISGAGAGQTQTITDNTATVITVADWDSALGDPAANSVYQLSYAKGGDVLIGVQNSDLLYGGFKVLGGDNGGYVFRVSAAGNVEIGGNGAGAGNLTIKQNLTLTGGNIIVNSLATPTGGLAVCSTVTSGGLDNATYYYRVSAINTNGETLAIAEFNSGACAGGAGLNSVIVTWDAVAGATAYKIYGRSTGAELFMATVSAPNLIYIDDNTVVTPAGALPSANTTGGSIGIGMSSPARKLDILDASNPQLRLTQASGSVYTEFQSKATTGDLDITTGGSGKIVTFLDNTLKICASGACPTITGQTGTGDLIVENEAYFDGSKIVYPSDAGFTQPKRSIILTAGGAIIPTTSGAAQTKVDGSNQTYYVLDYDADSDEASYWEWTMPDSYSDSTIDITYYWTAAATSGDTVWCFQARGAAAAEAVDAALSSAVCETGTAPGTTQYMVSTTESAATSNFTKGENITFKVFRDANNGSDTMTGDARLLKIKIEYSVSQETD